MISNLSIEVETLKEQLRKSNTKMSVLRTPLTDKMTHLQFHQEKGNTVPFLLIMRFKKLKKSEKNYLA